MALVLDWFNQLKQFCVCKKSKMFRFCCPDFICSDLDFYQNPLIQSSYVPPKSICDLHCPASPMRERFWGFPAGLRVLPKLLLRYWNVPAGVRLHVNIFIASCSRGPGGPEIPQLLILAGPGRSGCQPLRKPLRLSWLHHMWSQLLVTADIMVWLLPHAAWHSGRSLPSRWRLEVAVFAWGKPAVFRRFGGRGGGRQAEIENGAEIIWCWWGLCLSLTIIMNFFARQSLAAYSSLTFDLPPFTGDRGGGQPSPDWGWGFRRSHRDRWGWSSRE